MDNKFLDRFASNGYDNNMKKKPMTIEQLAKIVKSAFDDITSRMATKDDLRGFTTKDDLKGFATKEELRSGYTISVKT